MYKSGTVAACNNIIQIPGEQWIGATILRCCRKLYCFTGTHLILRWGYSNGHWRVWMQNNADHV